MVAYKPWLNIDVIVIPGLTHPLPEKPQKFLPKYDHDDDVLPKHHIKQFMDALKLMNLEHEDVVCRFFPHTLQGKATKWFFNLAPGSIQDLSLLGRNLKRHLWQSLVMKKHQRYFL